MEKDTLDLIPSGDGFLLRQTDGAGKYGEILLTQKSVLSLAQSALRLRADILARCSRGEANAVATSFVSRAMLSKNLHGSQVFLTLFDNHDVPTTFSLPLEVAKPVAEHLPGLVAEMETAIPSQTKQ